MACYNTDLINELGSKKTFNKVYAYFRSQFPKNEEAISGGKKADTLAVDKYSDGSKKDLKLEMYTQDFIGNMFITLTNASQKVENFDNYLNKALKFHKFNVLSDKSSSEKLAKEISRDPNYTWKRKEGSDLRDKKTTAIELNISENPDYTRCASIRKAIDKVINSLKGGMNSKEYLIGKYLLKYEFTPAEIVEKLNLKRSWTYEIISGIKDKLRRVLREDVYIINADGKKI